MQTHIFVVKDAVKKFAYERERLTPRHARGIAELNGKRQQQIGKDDGPPE